MAEHRNRVGGAYSLTVVAPVAAGQEAALRASLDSLPVGPESPLARLDTLHFSRLHVVDELVDQGPPARPPQRLACAYLVFTSTFDGELDPYLYAVCARVGPEADGWWRHCAGYPGTADRAAFGRWIRAHQIDSSLFASAYPRAGVADVLASLELRSRIVAFAAEAQGLDASLLQQRFRETFAA